MTELSASAASQSISAISSVSAPSMDLSSAIAFIISNQAFNIMAVIIGLLVFGLLWAFYKIQKSERLDFADMLTKDGRSVSLTKVLQLIGGVTATWIMVKLTLNSNLTESLFGLYLTYVGAIEGYSKYVAAKYNYKETSVKDAEIEAEIRVDDSIKSKSE